MGGSRDRDKDRTRDRDRHRSERHRSNRHSMAHNSHSRRSPDCYYRTDNNSDDDNYDNSRRHRNQDYDRYDSDRSRSYRHSRDRSRSKDSRDRDRNRDPSSGGGDVSTTSGGTNSHNNRYYNEDYNTTNESANEKNESYDRDRTHYQRDKREEVPNHTLMIRGLAAHITESDIVSKLAEHSLQAKDIRLMRKKETGVSRGFAFVEFSNIEDAVHLKDTTQGYVVFGEEYEASVHYSIPKDSFSGDKNIMKNDWTCYKCGVNNFKRREECFKCGTPKEESLANDTGDEISLSPTNALLFRNLSANTTESRILTILGSLTALPIKSIRILRDPTFNISRGICLVELHTTLEASQLFTLLSSMSSEFIIDDNPVAVNYGKRNVTLAHINTNTSNAAIAALAAAQWRNLDDDTSKPNVQNASSSSTKKSGTVCVNGVEYQKYETPDVSTFQLDESSGYYYDSTTGFYYDSNTQYYYNSQSQQYLYWEPSHKTYLAVESTGSQSCEESKKDKIKDPKADKVKIAKKIAKDMEKWAKTLNQKKDTSRLWTASEPAVNPSVNIESTQTLIPLKSTSADSGFALIETQISNPETESITYESINASELKSSLETKNPFFINPYQMIKEEENRLTDWEKLACLLCKRQFSSPELLTKHQQLSDLHKTNLNVLKHQKLSDEQIEELDRTERECGYRDRAKERRRKYGLPETPEVNKLKTKYLTEIVEMSTTTDTHNTSTQLSQTPISGDNIGNKMLKAMGWTEGTGLGKTNQGMSNIIEVEMRKGGLGLGMKANTTAVSGETYKDAVRRTMQLRFKEMN